MDNVIQQVFSMSTVILCLFIWILVMIQRRLVEYFWAGAKQNKLWNELILPLWPLVTGGLVALIPQYPYPHDFSSFWARVVLGVVCGLASAHVYKIVKKFWVTKEETSTSENPTDELK